MQKCDTVYLIPTHSIYFKAAILKPFQSFYLTFYIPAVHNDIFFVSFKYHIVFVYSPCTTVVLHLTILMFVVYKFTVWFG